MKLHFNMYTVLSFVLAIAMVTLLATGHHSAALLIAPGAAALPELEELVAEFKTKSKEIIGMTETLRTSHAELDSKMKNGETVSAELKAAVDKLLVGFNEQKTYLNELEQKIATRTEQEKMSPKTWGEQITESPAYNEFKTKSASGNPRGTFAVEVKAITSTVAAGLIRSQREDDVVGLPKQRRVMRDLLNVIPATSSSIDYAKQTVRTNAAATVAESAAKPYSQYEWVLATTPVRVIAHLAKLTRQAMDDAPRLMGEIDQEMRYGLGYVEERQFLYGNNTGQNLNGIVPQATAFAKPTGYVDALATRIDVLRLAMLQCALSLFPADGIVLSDTDWALIELTKTTEGAYILANPQGSVTPRMWGLPVVATPAMVDGDFLVGAFKIGATVYDRMGVEVLISTENSDDFEKNLATMRAEERVAMAVKRPLAFITGTFVDAIADIAA